jgi:hypothetical protein
MQYSLGDHVVIQSKLLPPAGLVEEVVNLAAGFVEGLVRNIADLREDEPPLHERATSGYSPEDVDWVGEIEKIYTDGRVKVRLARQVDPPPDWTGERYDIVQGGDLIVFEADEEDDEEMDDIIDAEYWTDDDDVGAENSDSEDEWEDASEGDMDDEEIPEASLDGMDEVETAEPFTNNVHFEEVTSSIHIDTETNFGVNKEKCPRFDILETVPDDHPFKSDAANGMTPDWLTRIRKEHKILQSSLPGNSLKYALLINRGHSGADI